MKRLVCLSWLGLAAGCGDDAGYCIAEVRAEDQGQGVTDPGFSNPEAVGTTICWGASVGESFCAERDGIFGSVDDYEDGAEPFCAENAYTTPCFGGQLWVADGDACPEWPFTTTTYSGGTGPTAGTGPTTP